MLMFTSALGSDLAITADITLMGTIIRTGIITGRTIATLTTDLIATPTTDLTIGMGDANVITATTVILTTVTGNEVTDPMSWLAIISRASSSFF
jgi:hypothetical protein